MSSFVHIHSALQVLYGLGWIHTTSYGTYQYSLGTVILYYLPFFASQQCSDAPGSFVVVALLFSPKLGCLPAAIVCRWQREVVDGDSVRHFFFLYFWSEDLNYAYHVGSRLSIRQCFVLAARHLSTASEATKAISGRGTNMYKPASNVRSYFTLFSKCNVQC